MASTSAISLTRADYGAAASLAHAENTSLRRTGSGLVTHCWAACGAFDISRTGLLDCRMADTEDSCVCCAKPMTLSRVIPAEGDEPDFILYSCSVCRSTTKVPMDIMDGDEELLSEHAKRVL